MPQDPNVANLTRVLDKNPALAYQPATATALAYSSAKDEDVNIASGYLRGKQLTEALGSLPSDEQIRYWERMDQQDRNMARASGYLLPIEAHEVEHQNALERGFGKALSAIGKVTPNAVEAPLKSILHGYANVVEGTIQRGMRTVLIAGGEGIAGSGGLFDVTEYDRYWRMSDRDEAAVNPETEARIRDQYGDKLVDLLRIEQKKPGYIGSAFENLMMTGDTEQAAQLDEIMRSPEFNSAFNELENARISIGRALPQFIGNFPGMDGLEDNEQMFNILSGPVDATWRLMTDPLNRLTSGKTANRRFVPNIVETGIPGIAQGRQAYAIPKFSEDLAKAKIETAFSGADKASQNVIRYFDQAGTHLDTIRTAPGTPEAATALRELKRNYTKTWFMHESMMKYGVRDSATAKEYLLGDVGFRKVLSGDKATSLRLLPHRSNMATQVRKIKPGSMVDFLEKGHLFANENFRAATNELGSDSQITSKAAAELTGKELDEWRRSFRGRMATAGRRLNTPIVELDQFGQLDLMAEGATEQISRLARYYAPKFWADQVSSSFSAADDIVVRKNIVKGLLTTQAEATGILKTIEGKEWFGNYIRSIDQEMAGTYALGDVGKLANGERAAWLLEDARPTIPVPSFKEFHAQSAKVGLTKHLWGISNHSMVDWFMTTIWRPAMLLRPATAIRNGIDEVANVVVRNGARDWVTARSELRVANRNQWDSRKAAQASATAADDTAKALREQFDATPKPKKSAIRDEHRAYAKQERALVKAEEEAQVLYARFEGTKASFDPTAGRLYRMSANTAQFVVGKAARVAGMDTVNPLRLRMEKAARLETAHDLYMSNVYGKLSDGWLKTMAADKDKLTFMDDLVNDPAIREALEQDIIGSMRDSLSEGMSKIDQVVKFPGKKGQYRYVNINAPTKMTPANSSGSRAWNQRLNKMADDEVALLAMLHLDDEAKAIKLMSKALRDNLEYAKQLRTARDKTPDEFAAQVLAEVKAHFSDMNGNLIPEITGSMVQKAGGVRTLNRDAFSAEVLGELPMNKRPNQIIGRDGLLIEEGKSMYDLVQKSFTFFSEMTSYISRHPQMVDEYLTSRSNLVPWQQSIERQMLEKLALVKEPAPLLPKSVVREGGELVRVYHGTNRSFENFDNAQTGTKTDAGWYGEGHYFTVSPEYASQYTQGAVRAGEDLAPNVRMAYLDLRKVWNWEDDVLNAAEVEAIATSMGVPAKTLTHEFDHATQQWVPRTNPMTLEDVRRSVQIKKSGLAEASGWTWAVSEKAFNEAFMPILKARGHDGIKVSSPRGGGAGDYVVFDAKKIHSPHAPVAKDAAVADAKTRARITELAKAQAHKAAVEDATLKVLSYVDNPAVRSQASILFRNIAPFYRAQEEFFRRWSRTMKYSPEMFARANLYLDGMDNSGMMFTDSDGTKYFTYPGTKVMSEAMAKVGNAFGLPMDILPVPVPMTGEVNMLAPGFQSDMWTKVFNGPIHSIPVAVMENMTGNPRLAEFQRKAYGDVSAGQPAYMGLIPSLIRPAFDAYTNPDQKMFSAMKQASAYLIANGDIPTNDPKSRQEWMEKLRRHARGLLVYKAVMAPMIPAAPRIGTSSAPTTPSADAASQAEGLRYIDDRYHRLIEKVGWEDAYGFWMKEHPDEVPFLIGGTEGESSAHLPMTKSALDFMDENRAVMTRYKKASSFLVPQDPGDTDMDSWQLAMDLGVRKFKDINTYVDDVLKANDMSFYYEQKSKFDAGLLEAKASGITTTPLREEWARWRSQWLPFHPLVEAEILDGQVRDTNRQETLDEFREMLNDSDVPRTPGLEVMRELVDGYSRLEAAIAPIKSQRDDYSLEMKDTYRANFHKWAQEIAAGNPGAEMMYARIFKYVD